jgi:hypothetical protein
MQTQKERKINLIWQYTLNINGMAIGKLVKTIFFFIIAIFDYIKVP